MRLVESAHYADVALTVYMKVKALGQRPEGCTAGTTVLASYLGLSRSSVERGIAQLRRPGPDGLIELPLNQRRSLPGGCGTTARRRVRPMRQDERFIWLPVAACEDLSPRELRAFAVLCFAQAQRIPLTEGELAGHLRHHSGARVGAALSVAAAGRVVDALEAAGWITVLRRAGARGRHEFIAHDVPPAPEMPSTTSEADLASSHPDEGSGAAPGEGSLATKEDQRTDRPDDERRPDSPAVGEIQVVEGTRPVDIPGSLAAADGGIEEELALRAGERRALSQVGNGPRAPYGGPPLTLHLRIVEVLEPVRPLYQQANTFMQRRIAREIGRQLDSGCDVRRLRQRLTARFASVLVSDIKDPARWLMRVALPRWGCGHHACESGVMWPSGETCAACSDIVATRRWERIRFQRIELGRCPDHGEGRPATPCMECERSASFRPASEHVLPAPPRPTCQNCGCRIHLLGPALGDQLCKPCREQPTLAVATAPESRRVSERCVGRPGETCDRFALPTRKVCVRHRTKELLAETAGL